MKLGELSCTVCNKYLLLIEKALNHSIYFVLVFECRNIICIPVTAFHGIVPCVAITLSIE